MATFWINLIVYNLEKHSLPFNTEYFFNFKINYSGKLDATWALKYVIPINYLKAFSKLQQFECMENGNKTFQCSAANFKIFPYNTWCNNQEKFLLSICFLEIICVSKFCYTNIFTTQQNQFSKTLIKIKFHGVTNTKLLIVVKELHLNLFKMNLIWKISFQ